MNKMVIETFSVMTTELWVGSIALVSLVAAIAAAVTLYRQRRLLGSAELRPAAAAVVRDHGDDGIDDDFLAGNWPGDSGEVESAEETRRNGDRDPLEYCEHIPGEMKRVKQRLAEKKIQEEMTEDQREMERQVKRDQMEAIFRLLKEQEDKFGIGSMEDMDRQMSQYYNI